MGRHYKIHFFNQKNVQKILIAPGKKHFNYLVFYKKITEVYSELCKTSKMKRLAKILSHYFCKTLNL